MKVSQKERKQGNSNLSLGRKRQHTHPRPISDWLAEVDVAASMGEPDHSGFMFVRRAHHMEVANSWFRNCPRIHERLKRLSSSGRSTLTGRQIMYQIFSCFNINKTQGHTLNLNELCKCRVVPRQLSEVVSGLGRKRHWPLVMILMKVSSRNCAGGKCDSPHS